MLVSLLLPSQQLRPDVLWRGLHACQHQWSERIQKQMLQVVRGGHLSCIPVPHSPVSSMSTRVLLSPRYFTLKDRNNLPGWIIKAVQYFSHAIICSPPSKKNGFNATGADNYKTKPCPLGHVCPLGSTQPISCPPGTFGNLTHAKEKEDCHPCPANTFNHLPAQKACFPCGSSSTSAAG